MPSDTIHLELPRGTSQMRQFTITGIALGSIVVARWDGEFLIVSRTLYDLVCLARSVDEIFFDVECEDRWRLHLDTPSLIALEILGGLDCVTQVDCEIVDHADPQSRQ